MLILYQNEELETMSNTDNKGLRRLFTVITAPIWVPVAAAAGLVAAPVRAVKESVEEGKKKELSKESGTFL